MLRESECWKKAALPHLTETGNRDERRVEVLVHLWSGERLQTPPPIPPVQPSAMKVGV